MDKISFKRGRGKREIGGALTAPVDLWDKLVHHIEPHAGQEVLLWNTELSFGTEMLETFKQRARHDYGQPCMLSRDEFEAVAEGDIPLLLEQYMWREGTFFTMPANTALLAGYLKLLRLLSGVDSRTLRENSRAAAAKQNELFMNSASRHGFYAGQSPRIPLLGVGFVGADIKGTDNVMLQFFTRPFILDRSSMFLVSGVGGDSLGERIIQSHVDGVSDLEV